MSGFHTIPRKYRDETGRMVKGDSEDEIRRSVWRLAGRRLTQEEAARLAFQSPVLVAFCLRTLVCVLFVSHRGFYESTRTM